LAYEPIWAIGTGLRAEVGQIEETHAFLRQTLLSFWGGEGSSIPVIYGGSVKPDNVHDLAGLRGVDGALVGGASLKVEDFRSIVEAFASTL
jgi:triosephosphate isomerase